jgi:hypothetical protein
MERFKLFLREPLVKETVMRTLPTGVLLLAALCALAVGRVTQSAGSGRWGRMTFTEPFHDAGIVISFTLRTS